MKTFQQAKKAYVANHLSKYLKQPKRRINALKAIEERIEENSPGLLESDEIFTQYSKNEFGEMYYQWKGRALSNAEKSVLTGLFKFST